MSATISANFSDLIKITVELDRIPADFQKFQQNTLRDLQRLLLTNIQSKAPKNTGNYANSWKLGSITGNKAIVETPNGKLFIILEFQGRRPGRITPRTKQVLRFEDESGNEIFTMRVDHPGFPPIPHARPAMSETLQKAVSIIFENLKKTYPIFK